MKSRRLTMKKKLLLAKNRSRLGSLQNSRNGFTTILYPAHPEGL